MTHNTSNNKKILTLGVFAHANAGKTTITEQILYHCNIIKSVGRVDAGNTISDSMNLERERGISIKSSLVTFIQNKKLVQLIDTPGHIDFSAEVEKAIAVLDGAVLVVSGVEGVEPQTYTIWTALKKRSIPVIVFINKLDRSGADFNRTIENLKLELEDAFCPIVTIENETTSSLRINSANQENILNILTEVDDKTLELCIDNSSELTPKWVMDKCGELIREGILTPVIGGSALIDIGINELLDSIAIYMDGFNIDENINNEFSAFIYMVRNESGKRNLYTKILSGRISLRDKIHTPNGQLSTIKGLYKIFNNEKVSTDSAVCGEIVIINGIEGNIGDLLGQKVSDNIYMPFVNPLLTMEITPFDKGREIELVEALCILNDEDPYLNVRYDKNTNGIYIDLVGLIQAEVIERELLDRFDIKASFNNPIVIHKEVPTITAQGKASYTQFSAIGFEIVPLPRGSGIVISSKYSTDYLHKKYQLQASRLLKYYLNKGLYGWSLTDAEISIVDGRFNSAGSGPSHFNIIVPIALMRALKSSNIKILEPISAFTIVMPKKFMSVVTKNIRDINGIFTVTKDDNKKMELTGEAPSKNILNYQSEVIKMTSGRGVFSSYIKRYEISSEQNIMTSYVSPDPRNEVTFIMEDMGGSLDALDIVSSKPKKASRSKFKRQQQEKKK